MRQLVRCWVLLILIAVAQQAAAAGIVHVANGDCAGLAAAANAPPGQEPALIVLAGGGVYNHCPIDVSGKIVIDGAGAALSPQPSSGVSQPSPIMIKVESGASLTLRNALLGPSPSAPPPPAASASAATPKFCCIVFNPALQNAGTTTLDSVSIAGNQYVPNVEVIALGVLVNSGNMVLRNVSVVGNSQGGAVPALLATTGPVDISHSTLVTTPQDSAVALLGAEDGGSITLANSIVVNNGSTPGPNCVHGNGGTIVSRGGNVFSDASCNAHAPDDRIAQDLHALDFGLHGGVVGTLALDTNSPALDAGLAKNCEATDARGLSRSTQTCDAGALEVGAGRGRLTASGMSGLYYNASNNGHYVTVQRLFGDNALVIWNTFDTHGVPAWLYGVGSVSNGTIHVAQVAQNVGGTLHAGGAVSGATPTLWGAFDFSVSDCFNASLTYTSPNGAFGSGTTALQRLAFVDGLDCQR